MREVDRVLVGSIWVEMARTVSLVLPPVETVAVAVDLACKQAKVLGFEFLQVYDIVVVGRYLGMLLW